MAHVRLFYFAIIICSIVSLVWRAVMSNKKDRFFSSPSVWLSIGASLFLLIVNLFLSAAPAYAQSDLIPPTAVKCFDDFGYLWQQTVDINNLDANGDVVADLWFDTGATTSFSVPGPFPAAFDGPVYVKIHEVGVYDAGTNRANEGEQADERVKIVLLKDGNVVWESDWSGDSATR